jgi:hypothetical protein
MGCQSSGGDSGVVAVGFSVIQGGVVLMVLSMLLGRALSVVHSQSTKSCQVDHFNLSIKMTG